MAPAQIAEGQKLSRELWKKYVVPFQDTVLADDPLRLGDTFKDCDDCPEMVAIPPGQFRMSDLLGEGYDDEKPINDVRIKYSSAVGKFEVTQAECRHVMGNNPSHFRGDDRPVKQVSWKDAQRFIGKLTGLTLKKWSIVNERVWLATNLNFGGTNEPRKMQDPRTDHHRTRRW
ncbi:MAG: hypothetical protein CMM23_09340 [Rhodospirillaceae bacterium]|nr:hypothetical protein [Rhodospirillaceae bacterium]HJM93595.1 SUMF1/EgtB/PvdO family nonheme iron enzyme [Alphaproteobacteria bacterium]